MNKRNTFIEKKGIILIIIAIIWLIIGPYLLTNFSIYDLTKSGNIGSAFSGITSPIIALISAVLLYITILKQIDTNKQNSNEANFRIIYDSLSLVRNNIDKFSYKNKLSKEGFELFATTVNSEIKKENTKNLIAPTERVSLTFLEIGRVFSLKYSLKTSVEFNQLIENELIHIYSYYLSTAHSTMITWDLDCQNLYTESLARLDFIKGELNEIE